jgi:hypothetical protein
MYNGVKAMIDAEKSLWREKKTFSNFL